MAKLNDFISEVKQSGLMRTARYTVIIPTAQNSTLLSMYCDQVQLPGLNYNTVANASYGETREVPYGRLFDNLSLSFYVDNEMIIKKFFDDWMYTVQDPNDRSFNYYKNYIKDIQIQVEDTESNTKYSIMLHECYPKTIGSIQLDYASKDVMKLNVTLAYKYWKPVDGYNMTSTYINRTQDGLLAEYQNIFTGITGIIGNALLTNLENSII